MRRAGRFLAVAAAAVWAAVAAAQALPAVPKPGPRDLCPVCGMLVSKYPTWTAGIVYKDGHAHYFDGAKDMFKFWFDPGRYAKGHRREDIALIWVTDYYSLQPVDARQAYYVAGSDVLGPMGHELVPLATAADADDFIREHKGRRQYRFEAVTVEVPLRLDGGNF